MISLTLRLIGAFIALISAINAIGHASANSQAALAWALVAAFGVMLYVFEKDILRRRAAAQAMAEAIAGQRQAIMRLSADLVGAGALVSGAAARAAKISEAIS